MIITLAPGPTPPSTRGSVYLPIVVTPPLDPVVEFVRLLTSDTRQQHPVLTYCPKLATAATWRAHGLAHGQPFSHTDHDGNGANVYARRAGCVLPSDYSEKGNNIEALVAGTHDPAVAFAALASSPAHSIHLFGRGWFAHQTHYGIALAENQEAPHRWYWCVLLAHCLD